MGFDINISRALEKDSHEMAGVLFWGTTPEIRRKIHHHDWNKIEIEAKRQLLLEELRRSAIIATLNIFDQNEIPYLITKGSALAYGVYPEPWLRPRLDTDLLLGREDFRRAVDLLVAANYKLVPGQSFAVRKQATLICPRTKHPFDLHAQAINPKGFREYFDFRDLFDRSIAVPSLGKQARMPLLEDSLALACTHRVIHHPREKNEYWLLDVFLLGERLGDQGLREAALKVREQNIFDIWLSVIFEAEQSWGEFLPEALRTEQKLDKKLGKYLNPKRRFWHDLVQDLRDSVGPGEAFAYLKAHIFPPLELIQAKYPKASPLTLAFYYVLRLGGAFKRLFSRTLP